jgi:hypothetical protein
MDVEVLSQHLHGEARNSMTNQDSWYLGRNETEQLINTGRKPTRDNRPAVV